MLEIRIGFLATNIEEKKKRDRFPEFSLMNNFLQRTYHLGWRKKKFLSEYHRKNRKLICIKFFFLGKQNLPTSTLNVIIKNLWVWKVLGCNRLQPLRKFKFRGEKATIKQLAFKAHRLVWLEDSGSIAEQGGDSPLEWALGGPCTLSFLCLLSVLWTWLTVTLIRI